MASLLSDIPDFKGFLVRESRESVTELIFFQKSRLPKYYDKNQERRLIRITTVARPVRAIQKSYPLA